MDEVVIGIGINENKKTWFPTEKRVEMIEKLFAADINRKLAGIETILLFTEPELTSISSTIVRELLQFGKDVTPFLPEGMKID